MAATGKHHDRSVSEVDLNTIAVEFDLLNPALAGRHLLDRRCQLRFDEARAGSLDADRGRFSSLERHKQNPALAGFQGDPAEIVPALEP
jgi:hypothetical protein